jgi:hypothetical protein
MLCGSIVKKRIRQAFDDVNNDRWDELMTSIIPRVHHRFGGVHAIGGERHDRETLRLWFERLARVLPNLHLTINNIWVKGPPCRDLPKIDVPVLVVHGTEDRILPYESTAARLPCSTTSSWSRSAAGRTTSPGRIRTRSTRHYLSSSAPPLTFLGHLLGRHVDEEAAGFARDIVRKHHEADGEGDRQRAEGGRR